MIWKWLCLQMQEWWQGVERSAIEKAEHARERARVWRRRARR